MEFKDNLLMYRKERGFSQEGLAILCNVSRQAISKWENGTANPDMDNLKMLAQSLKVSLDDLLGNETETNMKQEIKDVYIVHRASKEYTSTWRFLGLPLVDINVGLGKSSKGKRRVAKGWIAIGNTAIGVFSIGMISAGLISIGIISFGLLFAIGCLAISYFAIAPLAIGYIAIGAMAVGVYSVGALSIGFQLSIGALAYGFDAIGCSAYGEHVYLISSQTTCFLDQQAFTEIQQMLSTRSMPAIIRMLIETIPLCG